jgi:hypothetical protein
MEGEFVFSIIDSNLNFEEINKNLTITPTKTIKKGQMIGKTKNIEAPYDIWSFEMKFDDGETFNECFDRLINEFLPFSKFIKEISTSFYKVGLSCYIRSDFGQLGFELSVKNIILLKEIGIPIEFHVLSFGLVEK